MAGDVYASLAWLAPAPADFRQQCRAVAQAANPGQSIAHLAGYSLDESQLRRLADAITAVAESGRSLAPLSPLTLGVLGNATLEPIVPALIASAARHGIFLRCVKADFAQVMQEAVAPDSVINRAKPDAVLLALDHRGLPLRPGLHSPQSATAVVDDAIAFTEAVRSELHKHSNTVCILQTLAPLPETLFGSYDRVSHGSWLQLTDAYNAALVAGVRGSDDIVLDVASLAATVGTAHWHSPTQWNIAKLAFAAQYLPLYAEHVARVLGAMRGKSRRCLVLDLDNTVWGGVIGDDGLEGIVIGQGDATGEAYLDVQRFALALRDRGVVLAVSSKNTDAIARAAFIKHPEMLLREKHIAVFQANWNDKATNITAIASELALGLDSMVFLDDNPAERALVRRLLPQVAVPELPENPALYARTLSAAGYFEAIMFSEEDRKRADFYTDNARRVALATQAGDLDAYLASLDMKIDFRPFDATGRSRIAQLIAKSNQFNLTTRRYTEPEVAALEADPSIFTLQVRLLDTFGDNGMISVIICRPVDTDVWEIDTWLMSCRVLGRRVEQMVLREILLQARERGIKRVIGRYIPTERNAMVRDHYSNLGFSPASENGASSDTWQLETDTEIAGAPMAVSRA